MSDVEAIKNNKIFSAVNFNLEDIKLFNDRVLNSIQKRILEKDDTFFEAPSSIDLYSDDNSFEELLEMLNTCEEIDFLQFDKLFNKNFCGNSLNKVETEIEEHKNQVFNSKINFDKNFIEVFIKELEKIGVDFILGNRFNTVEEDLSIHYSVKASLKSMIEVYNQSGDLRFNSKQELTNYFSSIYEDEKFINGFLSLLSNEITIEDIVLLYQVFSACIAKVHDFYNFSPEQQFNRDFVFASKLKLMILMHKTNKEVKKKLGGFSIFEYGFDSLLDYVIKQRQLSSIGRRKKIYSNRGRVLTHIMKLIRNFS